MSSDTTLLIDSWANTARWDGVWREPVVHPQNMTASLVVLIRHLHIDHFDEALVREFLAKGRCSLCTPSMEPPTVASLGISVRSAASWEPFIIGSSDFTVVPVPTQDYSQEVQVSWVVIGGGRHIIHADDTSCHRCCHSIGREFGPFNAPFLLANGL